MKDKKYVYLNKSRYEEQYLNMKKLVVNEKTLLYRRKSTEGDGTITTFYELTGQVPEKRWSWGGFRFVLTGKNINNYVELFHINYWIEDPRFTKDEVRGRIEHCMKLVGRKEEISKGEIV